ncbi:hypothetical protein [Leptospira interrogans]|uniref:hypothetical protein n=1 Tax=Leptospira interrogans TaxID=173 RepID=UPI00027858B9|nr:hypothetical protein [Leptospira interrogans]EJP16402.1 hypothetical protein LEP1GSC080_0644 [Leptospira interrogans str. FPW2026]
MDQNQEITPEQMQQILTSGTIPQVYFNGFATGVSTGDINLTLMLNGRPVLILNASYTVAKTLSQKLKVAIDLVETKNSFEIKTIDELTKGLKP